MPQQSLSESQPRLPQLDAMRGLAALYVVIFHVMAMPEPDLAVPAAALPIVGMGGTGVALFFVMSAFSLCLTWPRHAESGMPLGSFYLSRLFRIAPLILVLLSVMVFKDQFRPAPLYSYVEAAWNYSLLFGLSAQWQQGIVMGSWTIGVEMLFYALFPLIAMRLRGLWPQLALLVLSYLFAAWAKTGLPAGLAHFGAHIGLISQMPVFALGCVLFELWRRMRGLPQRRASAIGVALLLAGLAGLGGLFYGVLPTIPLLSDNTWFLAALFYGSMLLGLLLASNRLLVNRVTCFLGAISYSLYLVHPFLVSRLYGVFAKFYAALPDGIAYLACLTLSLALTVPAAWLTYRFIEKPGIRLGHRLLARLRARKRADAASGAAY
ncbi:acyltransferase family protein [Pseudomonas sp. CGJS7]|uniref:acyltransferase family protein n=1 Tax=Pseudomonas sp. CGJS7 TaxID=3109348 RepID=UPI003009693B